MNPYVLLAYVAGLGLLWGYTLSLWMTDRAVSRRERGRFGRQRGVMKHVAVTAVAATLLAGLLGLQQMPPDHPPLLPPGHPPVAPPGPEAPAAQPAAPEDVASADAVIRAYYAAISGPKGAPRAWDRFRGLFMPGARLVATRPGQPGAPPVTFTVEQFIRLNGQYFEAGGYFEREVDRRTDAFGHIAQAFSSYESRRGDPDSEPYSRGVNGFQLVSSGGRWWIVGLLWDREDSG